MGDKRNPKNKPEKEKRRIPDTGTNRKQADGQEKMPSRRPGPKRKEVHPDDVNAPSDETGHEEVHPDDVESS